MKLEIFGAAGQLRPALYLVEEPECDVCRATVPTKIPYNACETHYKQQRAALHEAGVSTAEFDV